MSASLSRPTDLVGIPPDVPPDDREMWCERCGRRHGAVWFAPSDLWNAVMREGDRGKPDEFGFCCPNCFIQLAEEREVVSAAWRVAPAGDNVLDRLDAEIVRMEDVYESHCRGDNHAKIVQADAHLNGLKAARAMVANG